MFKRSIFAAAALVIHSNLFAIGPVSQADYLDFHPDAWGNIGSQSMMQAKLQAWDPDSLRPGYKRNFQCACPTGHAFA